MEHSIVGYPSPSSFGLTSLRSTPEERIKAAMWVLAVAAYVWSHGQQAGARTAGGCKACTVQPLDCTRHWCAPRMCTLLCQQDTTCSQAIRKTSLLLNFCPACFLVCCRFPHPFLVTFRPRFANSRCGFKHVCNQGTIAVEGCLVQTNFKVL